MDTLRFTGINEYGSILGGAALSSTAMSNFREGTSLPTVVTSSSMGGGGGDTSGESSAPGSGEGVGGAGVGAGGQGRALEGWRGWSM
ncbi:hypothetical protein FS749_004200 [Ceratobasidium sp. UAMH 11750]|nr:hypothetical protein FS749_004200 [Ceratobasidium sp. UAMH 11750]